MNAAVCTSYTIIDQYCFAGTLAGTRTMYVCSPLNHSPRPSRNVKRYTRLSPVFLGRAKAAKFAQPRGSTSSASAVWNVNPVLTPLVSGGDHLRSGHHGWLYDVSPSMNCACASSTPV